MSYPVPFFCCAQPPAASTPVPSFVCSASTCSALQSDVAGLRTSLSALQAVLNPDADGTINPARVCFQSICLESIVAYGLVSHTYVRTKDRTQDIARFSTTRDRLTVSANVSLYSLGPRTAP